MDILKLYKIWIILTISINYTTIVQSINLHLNYLSHCTFHVIQFDPDDEITEKLLVSNQYNQPWTMFNTSRPFLRPIESIEDAQIATLNARESKFCNVHLLIQPNFLTRHNFHIYPSVLSKNQGENVFYIFITVSSRVTLPVMNSNLGFKYYNFPMFNFLIDESKSRLIQKFWICIPCEHHTFQRMEIHERINNFQAQDKIGRHLHGGTVQVIDLLSYQGMNPTCLNEYYYFRNPGVDFDPHPCRTARKATRFIIQRLNGTMMYANSLAQLLQFYSSIHLETYLVSFQPSQFYSYQLIRKYGLVLIYCDYDKQRMHDDSNWVKAFDLSTWVILIAFCSIGAIITTCHVGGLIYHIFNSFTLILGEGAVKTLIQLGIVLAGFFLTTEYEMYLTSLVLAPNPPLQYSSLQEVIENNYKIRYNPAYYFVPPEISYVKEFEQENVLHLINSSFEPVLDIQQLNSLQVPPHRLNIIKAGEAESQLLRYQMNNPNSRCHIVKKPFLDNKVTWTLFYCFLRDKMLHLMQNLIEFGFIRFWESGETIASKVLLRVEARKLRSDGNGRGIVENDENEPKPISMDFKVMLIFPFSGYLILVCCSIFILELIYNYLSTLCSSTKVEYIRRPYLE